MTTCCPFAFRRPERLRSETGQAMPNALVPCYLSKASVPAHGLDSLVDVFDCAYAKPELLAYLDRLTATDRAVGDMQGEVDIERDAELDNRTDRNGDYRFDGNVSFRKHDREGYGEIEDPPEFALGSRRPVPRRDGHAFGACWCINAGLRDSHFRFFAFSLSRSAHNPPALLYFSVSTSYPFRLE